MNGGGRAAAFVAAAAAALVLCWCAGDAAPVHVDRGRGVGSTLGAIDYARILEGAYFSSAAYCLEQNLLAWNCSRCNVTGETANFTVVDVFYDKSYDLQGYVGYSDILKAIIVAFRGTDGLTGLENWIENLKFFKADFEYEGCRSVSPCYVHRGFYQCFNETYLDGLGTAVYRSLKDRPTYPIHVTGHSLGGAIAILAALNFTADPLITTHVSLATFGEPRVGNLPFAQFSNITLGEFWRVTHYEDIVPHLPTVYFGFHHSAREYWISKPVRDAWVSKVALRTWELTGTLSRHCSQYGNLTDLVACDGSGEDPACADSISIIYWSLYQHLTYLNVPMQGLPC